MKTDNVKRFQGIVLVCALFAIGVNGQGLSKSERERALHYLAETRAGVVQAVTGLSDAQLKFAPAPGRWCIAEILEHITVTESFFLERIAPQLEQSPAPVREGDAKDVDRMIVEKVPDRSTRYQAPAMLQPTGRWAPQAICYSGSIPDKPRSDGQLPEFAFRSETTRRESSGVRKTGRLRMDSGDCGSQRPAHQADSGGEGRPEFPVR
jgi:hypothetical protein